MLIENIVYNELLVRGYHVDTGIIDVYGKDKEGKRIRKQLEAIDELMEKGYTFVPVDEIFLR